MLKKIGELVKSVARAFGEAMKAAIDGIPALVTFVCGFMVSTVTTVAVTVLMLPAFIIGALFGKVTITRDEEETNELHVSEDGI